MSVFASYVQKTLDVPFDDGQTITIKKLSAKHLEEARRAQQIASVEFVKQIGGPEFQRELSAGTDPERIAAAVARQQADPLMRYDRATLLKRGVAFWSYDVAVSPDTLDDLSEEASAWLAREILTLTLPPTGDDEKKST